MSRSVTLLVNPAARSGAAAPVAARAAAELRARGVQTRLTEGGSAAEFDLLLRDAVAARPDAIVVCGGDGTVHLALQRMAGTGIPLGIIPCGTGNDFAAAVGVDATTSVDAIAAGAVREIDLARVTRTDGTTRLYGSVLASGFDARVNDRANAMRWPRGALRYTLSILIEFLALTRADFAVEAVGEDDRPIRYRGGLIMATVGNGRSYGGGIPICPDADLADGLLDLVLVRPLSRTRLLRLLPRVYAGTHLAVDEVIAHRVRAVRIAAPGVTAYADGDPVGALPLHIEAVPGALRVLAPAR
ncbi:diacylglycerol kinase [Microbacterium hominis]|uniref:Diacylglycerol kinase n=1 Tax=Microbacterium hominis TaxID=162426 RepID=A0A7D4UGP9_9MICO|nr:diacylglycerol kinase [Microbacterium hominis]QKJ19969.1 diacylglycerol kinase [Microbacterium hominis]